MDKTIRHDDARLSWAGAVSVMRTMDWSMPWRIPYEQEDLFAGSDPKVVKAAKSGSGVRLTFRSDTRSLDGKVLRAVKAARSISSPSGGMRAVCVELRAMLGLKVRHAGMLVRDKGDRELVGRVTVGHRDKEGWRVEEDVTVGVSEARKR